MTNATNTVIPDRKLTHGGGDVKRCTSSGRVAESWAGAFTELNRKLGTGHNLINRGGEASFCPIPIPIPIPYPYTYTYPM